MIRDPPLMVLLLNAGADPNAQDRDGRTLVMHVAARGRADLVRLLLSRGADMEIKAANGDTADTLAAGDEVVRVLREATERR